MGIRARLLELFSRIGLDGLGFKVCFDGFIMSNLVILIVSVSADWHHSVCRWKESFEFTSLFRKELMNKKLMTRQDSLGFLF